MEVQTSEPLDVNRIRQDFPILSREVGDGVQLVYLDNAATSQTPESVINAMDEYYRRYNANVHRGLHHLSQEASIAYEDAHDRLARFVGASGGRSELIFTKNTTEAINLVAYAWGLKTLGPEDEIVLTEMEHHASLVTWQQIAKMTGSDVRFIRITEEGYLDLNHAQEIVSDNTAILSVVHISNALGTVNPVTELASLAHDHDAYILVDGAQAVPNRPVDVESIDADFYAFSGHKMAGPTGIGCLYGKQSLLESMDPFLFGGEMIKKVTFDDSRWNDVPWKFEAGTPPIAEGIGLAAAADYLDSVDLTNIKAHEEHLTEYGLSKLQEMSDVEIYGPTAAPDRAGLISFNLDGVHAHDLASIVNDHGVAIRAGDHCTQPLHDRLGVAASARASFYLYNTLDEIDILLDSLEEARSIFD